MYGLDIPLRADTLELALVVWICLNSQTGCEYKLTDGGAEAGQERVEGLLANVVSNVSSRSLYIELGLSSFVKVFPRDRNYDI